MIPSTCPYRRNIRKKVTPETFNMRKFRFFAQTGYSWPLEQRNLTTDLFCNIFKGFAALPNVNPSWLTDWITFIRLQYPKKPRLGEMTIFLLLERSTELFTFEQHFFHLKEINVKNEVNEFLLHTFFQVRCEPEKNILKSNSTILDPITEVKSTNLNLIELNVSCPAFFLIFLL